MCHSFCISCGLRGHSLLILLDEHNYGYLTFLIGFVSLNQMPVYRGLHTTATPEANTSRASVVHTMARSLDPLMYSISRLRASLRRPPEKSASRLTTPRNLFLFCYCSKFEYVNLIIFKWVGILHWHKSSTSQCNICSLNNSLYNLTDKFMLSLVPFPNAVINFIKMRPFCWKLHFSNLKYCCHNITQLLN